jgi:hypothetical protein
MFGLLTLSGILEIDLFNALEITKDRADKIGHTNRSANFCPTALYF